MEVLRIDDYWGFNIINNRPKSPVFCTCWNEGQLDKAFMSTIQRHFLVATGPWIAEADPAFYLSLSLRFKVGSYFLSFKFWQVIPLLQNQSITSCVFQFPLEGKTSAIKKGLHSNQRPQRGLMINLDGWTWIFFKHFLPFVSTELYLQG